MLRKRSSTASSTGIVSRKNSWSSDDSLDWTHADKNKSLEPPVLVYHSCARSIVFRDEIRRASIQRTDSTLSSGSTMSENDYHTHETLPSPSNRRNKNKIQHVRSNARVKQDLAHRPESPKPTDLATSREDRTAASFLPRIAPLTPLELGPNQEFWPLSEAQPPNTSGLSLTQQEQNVVDRLQNQRAAVKTIKNSEWAAFLKRFLRPDTTVRGRSPQNRDRPGPHFNSFVTSTSLLPQSGKRMRCYGSTTQYTTGLVFGMPHHDNADREDEIAEETDTWSWHAGYAAKTEFNVNSAGQLINGRKEALTPLSVMRQYNDDYVHKEEYVVGNKKSSGFKVIPYNEIFLRVGGWSMRDPKEVSFDSGVGLPIALFVRTATYGHLISMMRARARLMHVLGEEHVKGIPLLLITPENGVRVMTDALQVEFWKVASRSLNPFQNTSLAHKTHGANADAAFIQEKMNELIDFDETIRDVLTPEELARLAGGFGATDESVEEILTSVMEEDHKRHAENGNVDDISEASHRLQDVVNEGLAHSIRSGDYHTARQMLILYTVVAAKHPDSNGSSSHVSELEGKEFFGGESQAEAFQRQLVRSPDLSKKGLVELAENLSAPPPPPLDTDRLRSATNSDGLLAVLGAAQILRVMKDGSAQHRVEEVISALEEWIEYGQHSMAFRISSWQNQRAAQGDLKIAMESNSKFAAFAGKKAITNRKSFAQRLRAAAEATDFTDARFLLAIHEIVRSMHSPCLRLELLQYVLGLDNRYSVAHVARSVELAATCLQMAAGGSDE